MLLQPLSDSFPPDQPPSHLGRRGRGGRRGGGKEIFFTFLSKNILFWRISFITIFLESFFLNYYFSYFKIFPFQKWRKLREIAMENCKIKEVFTPWTHLKTLKKKNVKDLVKFSQRLRFTCDPIFILGTFFTCEKDIFSKYLDFYAYFQKIYKDKKLWNNVFFLVSNYFPIFRKILSFSEIFLADLLTEHLKQSRKQCSWTEK